MEQYFLDTEQSCAVYKKYKKIIKPKECYTNIFSVLSQEFSKFESGEWRVAYGFVSSIDCIYCRHCFILDKNDRVIDPTMYASERDTTNRIYYVMKVFDKLKDYISALDAEDGYPALGRYLKRAETKAQEWGNQNGCLFIG